MNVSMFINSLQYLFDYRSVISLSKWIYEDLTTKYYRNSKFEQAFISDDLEVLKILLPLVNQKHYFNLCYFGFIYESKGFEDSILLVCKKYISKENIPDVFAKSIKLSYYKLIEFFLTNGHFNNLIFCIAVQTYDIHTINMMIQYCDQDILDNSLEQIDHNNTYIVKLLIDHGARLKNISSILKNINYFYYLANDKNEQTILILLINTISDDDIFKILEKMIEIDIKKFKDMIKLIMLKLIRDSPYKVPSEYFFKKSDKIEVIKKMIHKQMQN